MPAALLRDGKLQRIEGHQGVLFANVSLFYPCLSLRQIFLTERMPPLLRAMDRPQDANKAGPLRSITGDVSLDSSCAVQCISICSTWMQYMQLITMLPYSTHKSNVLINHFFSIVQVWYRIIMQSLLFLPSRCVHLLH